MSPLAIEALVSRRKQDIEHSCCLSQTKQSRRKFAFSDAVVAMSGSRRLYNVELAQCDFRHLEVVGLRCPSPPALAEVQHRTPQMKVETPRHAAERIKEARDSYRIRPQSPQKREPLLFSKPSKQRVVTDNVVLPKKKPAVIERNCFCTCDGFCEQACNGLETSAIDVTKEIFLENAKKDAEECEIEVKELVEIILNYNKEGRMETSADIKNIVGASKGSVKVLSDAEVLQALATQTLTNLISHESTAFEVFLLKHSDVIGNIVNLLQYSPCLQQQESARLLALLACHKLGLPPLTSYNAVEHLLWALTCSHCGRLREKVSRALRNISANPDRDMALSALKQFVASKRNQSYEPSFHSLARISGVNESTAGEKRRHQSLPSPLTVLHAQDGGSKPDIQKTIGELTSVLSLAFQSDTIRLSSSDRHFLAAFGPKTPTAKMPTSFSEQDKYLNSLKIFTNVLVVMSNVITLSESVDGKTGETGFDARKLSHVVVMIENGGLNFLDELKMLSDKLLKANPPSFHGIDISNLSPKEITASLSNYRRDVIFENATKKKGSGRRYPPDFGFEQSEIDFVKEAVGLLSLFAETTAPDFDPFKEDMDVLQNSRSRRDAKRHISFRKTAVVLKKNRRFSKGRGGRKLSRSTSTRSLTRSMSQVSLYAEGTLKPSLSSTETRDQSEPSSNNTSAQEPRDMTQYVKQSLLDAEVMRSLAPWITCGVYDIQVNVLKVIRYLLHWKNSSSVPAPPASITTPKESKSSDVSQPLISKSSTLSQRFSSVTAPTRNSTNKSKHLGITCVRNVIRHCGAYLLDLLGPPCPSILGMKSLMVIREAIINGEYDTRLKIVKLGCFAQVLQLIRRNDDDETMQALGILVIRILVGNNLSLKQLFLAHGGMKLMMAFHEYKEGIVKEESALTLSTFRPGGGSVRLQQRARTAESRTKKQRQKFSGCEDIWGKVGVKWKEQDEVVRVLKKFNVRY